VWKEAWVQGSYQGYRNAQVTVLAPTGTIGYFMGAETTGVEPLTGWSYTRSWSEAGP